jgi:hypothetical protein
MFSIHRSENSLIVTRDHDPANSIRLNSMDELLQLRKRLNGFIDTLMPDSILGQNDPLATVRYIGTKQARKIAETRGYRLPVTTIVSACERNTIRGVRKSGGRYEFPEWNFLEWLDRWHSRHEHADEQSS